MQIGAIGNYSTGMLQISNNKLSPVQSFMSKQENNTEKGKLISAYGRNEEKNLNTFAVDSAADSF